MTTLPVIATKRLRTNAPITKDTTALTVTKQRSERMMRMAAKLPFNICPVTRLPPKQHHHMPDLHDDFRAHALRQLRPEFLLLLLELVELHFHQVMMRERGVHFLEEGGAEAVLADFEHGLEQLGARLEGAEFTIGEFFRHARRLGERRAKPSGDLRGP